MSKHHHEECCCNTTGGYGAGYGAYGYGYAGGGGCAGGGFNTFNRWIYALLILIVIVLQFGRRREKEQVSNALIACDDGVVSTRGEREQEIDNSVLFIIIVFLLVICAGCWGGSGTAGYGGGYGF